MLRVDEGDKTKKNECLKEYREAEEGKVVTTNAEGKNIQSKPRKKKDPTIRYAVNGSCRKKRLHHITNLVEKCQKQGKHIVRFAQETKRKGLIKTSAVQSEGSKIKNTTIDGKRWQPMKFIILS